MTVKDHNTGEFFPVLHVKDNLNVRTITFSKEDDYGLPLELKFKKYKGVWMVSSMRGGWREKKVRHVLYSLDTQPHS